ncbi:DUF916 and DUF3324 domain-containing protein [Vagococcus sp. DIV0080]|uniref:DUF916 and DUF3324 domain-containing protein n=1 Tax=Candidatus Vagococcus giribetii TaxID=2230876 RepID=A0ABS3HUE9_9ENTE|nr:DUF916 and DUF3324 domain-containing protein [Vagococcus sp. DIV0080]MBO0477334.1 DUF916 and DUF3324 domain-containing protein [Vagococcus sp. DIV0080]
MKKISKLIQLLVLSVLFISINGLTVKADGNMAVSVNAILPENQHNKEVTYYDLRMTPGQKQELEFELNNPSDKDETVKIEINNGTTNDSGSIDYSDRGKEYKRDNSLKLALSDVATAPDKVVVKKNSKETIKIKLDMPKEEFDGMIIGGIRVSKADEEDSKDESSGGGMQIKNKVAYTVGLNLSENDKEVKAELDLIKVFPGQTGGRNVVKANVQNNQPQLLEEIEYKAHVTKKGQTEVLHKSSVENYRFAPNSNFNFDISWESQPFRSGDYTLFMTAESKATGQKWEWKEDFKITADEAKKLNEKAIDLDKDNKWLYIIIGLILLLILIILYIVYRKVKKNKEMKRKKELRKKRKSSGRKKTSKRK